MAYSQVDPRRIIDSENWAISLLVTRTHALGHTLIVVEGLDAGVRQSIVAHFVPYIPNRGDSRATKLDLLQGTTPQGAPIMGQVKIIKKPRRRTATVLEKVGSPFTSKSWTITRQNAFQALRRIHADSLRGHAGVVVPHYNFRLLGQLVQVTPDTVEGMNCANWSQSTLREAGIRGQGGLIIDFPRTQTLPGSRADWLNGFYLVLTGLALGLRARL